MGKEIDLLRDKMIRKAIHLASDILNAFTEDEQKKIELTDKNHSKYSDQMIDYIQLVLVKEGEKVVTKERYEKLRKELGLHRKQKGIEWRQELYRLAKIEYKGNEIFNLKTALNIAYKKMSFNRANDLDFNDNKVSVYRGFTTYMKKNS